MVCLLPIVVLDEVSDVDASIGCYGDVSSSPVPIEARRVAAVRDINAGPVAICIGEEAHIIQLVRFPVRADIRVPPGVMEDRLDSRIATERGEDCDDSGGNA